MRIASTPLIYDGIQFKSTFESEVYKVLIKKGIKPNYEKIKFTLSQSIRPSIPFYIRHGKGFSLDLKPLNDVTYTPDFTFTRNGIFVIIEVKGKMNDVYPFKRNLFRKELEKLHNPKAIMFFEIRSLKEIDTAIKLIDEETADVVSIRKLLPKLPERLIPRANKLLEDRKLIELKNLIDSIIKIISKSVDKGSLKYANIDINSLYELQKILT